MRPIHAAVMVCLALSAAACGKSDSTEAAHVGESDLGRAVLLEVGQELIVTLSSNPSTGYSWSCAATLAGILSAGTVEYVPTQPVLPGSGGNDQIRLHATGSGRTQLECEYRRAWESAESAAKTVTYSVLVR